MVLVTNTKTDYIRRRKQIYREYCKQEGKIIDIQSWKALVLQWEFDYEMEQRYGEPTPFTEQ